MIGIITVFCCCFVFNVIVVNLIPKPLYWFYLTHSWEDKGVHTFHKGISSKVNVKARYSNSNWLAKTLQPRTLATTQQGLLDWIIQVLNDSRDVYQYAYSNRPIHFFLGPATFSRHILENIIFLTICLIFVGKADVIHLIFQLFLSMFILSSLLLTFSFLTVELYHDQTITFQRESLSVPPPNECPG